MKLWSAQEPDTFWIDYYAGLISSKTGDEAGALAIYEKAYAIEPQFIPLLMEIGKNYWFVQAPEKAIEYLKRVIEVEPDYDEANSALSQSLASIGRFEEAEAVMRPFIDLADVCSDRARQHGMVLIGLKRYQEAINAMTPSVRAWPQDLELNRQLSECYQLIGDDKQADLYSKAAEKGAVIVESISIRRNRDLKESKQATAIAELGHDIMYFVSRVEGRDILENALAINDRIPQAHRDLATYYLLTGLQERASFHQLKALELENENGNSSVLRATDE